MNSVLRAVSISCAARLAAIERLRFWRVRFSALLIPTTTPPITIAKMKMPMTISTMLKPASSFAFPEARRFIR